MIAELTAVVRELSYTRFNGLSTPRDTIINFWPYRSQGDYDHVPTRTPRHLQNLDEESISNERCSKDGCVEFVIAKQVAFRYPLCPEHWREAAEEREAVQAGAAHCEVEKAGEFYCESCGFKRVTKTSATREYDEYDHMDRFRWTDSSQQFRTTRRS